MGVSPPTHPSALGKACFSFDGNSLLEEPEGLNQPSEWIWILGSKLVEVTILLENEDGRRAYAVVKGIIIQGCVSSIITVTGEGRTIPYPSPPGTAGSPAVPGTVLQLHPALGSEAFQNVRAGA